MKRLKLKTRFFLYHTGIILLITAGLVGYIYQVVVNEMKTEDEQHFQLIAQKTTAQLDSFYYNMDHTAMQIAMNPEIVEVFRHLSKEPDGNYFGDNPDEGKKVKQLLETYNIRGNGEAIVLLYNQQGDFCWIFGEESVNSDSGQFFLGNTFRESEKFFTENQGEAFYRSPMTNILNPENEAKSIAVVRQISDYSWEGIYGFVEVWEPVQRLEEILSDIGEENYADILDSEGKIIYTSSGKSETIDYENKYEITLSLEHAPYEVRFHKRPIKLERELKRFYIILAVVVTAILGVALVWERIMFKYLSAPLLALDNSLKSIAMDNLSVEIADENSEDIVIRLENSFNKMLEKLKSTMQMQIAAKTNEVKAHLFALQSQMNPHFLHNILAIVSMEAQLDGNTKIPYICRELGGILRYTSQMGDGFSTINEECENAKKYMLLMKVRYEELFEYEIKTEEEAGGIRVPKLIVQPICENCFKHGFKKVEPVWKIFIHAWTHEKKWYILIRDNGGGFPREFLDEFHRFTQKLDKEEVKDILNSISIGGLCIPNIYTRMKITYGKDFLFELRNEENGACVLLGGRCDD
ncbi:MAG: sensor histidine kinase [Lachnospiraceae bacterium]